MRVRPLHSNEGSALLAVFWVVAMLGFLTFTTLAVVVNSAETQFTHTQAFEADLLLERGLALAAHPQIKSGDPILRQATDDASLEVTIESEAARFHLNELLRTNDQIVLPRVFRAWGLDLEQAQALQHAMQDWTDEDELVRATGAEQEAYARAGFANRPFNRPFQSLDEVALVRGMDQVEGHWRGWFTLWSQTGKLDVNDASAELIAAACECSPEAAASFVLMRDGPDELPNSDDDVEIQSLDQFGSLIGTAVDENIVTIGDSISRITCEARLPGYARKREVVLKRGTGRIQLYHWQEERIP